MGPPFVGHVVYPTAAIQAEYSLFTFGNRERDHRTLEDREGAQRRDHRILSLGRGLITTATPVNYRRATAEQLADRIIHRHLRADFVVVASANTSHGELPQHPNLQTVLERSARGGYHHSQYNRPSVRPASRSDQLRVVAEIVEFLWRIVDAGWED